MSTQRLLTGFAPMTPQRFQERVDKAGFEDQDRKTPNPTDPELQEGLTIPFLGRTERPCTGVVAQAKDIKLSFVFERN